MATSINIKYPMKFGSAGAFATNDSTVDAITDDLRILLLTNHGERPIHGDFGANLRSILFEQGPAIAQRAEDLIIAAIEKWMPFVILRDIDVKDSTTDTTLKENQIHIKLEFSVGQVEGALKQIIRI